MHAGADVEYARGANIDAHSNGSDFQTPALALARRADFILMVLGEIHFAFKIVSETSKQF